MLLPLLRKLTRSSDGPPPPDPIPPLPRRPLPVVIVAIDIDDEETVYFSDAPYFDAAAGIQPDVRCANDLSHENTIAVPMWGATRRLRSGYGALDLHTSGGDLAWLHEGDYRKSPVRIYLGDDMTPFAQFEQSATAIIEGITKPSDTIVRIALADTTADLEKVIDVPLYTFEGLEGRSKPLTMGTCFSVPIVQGGQPDLLYDAHDDGSAVVTLVRDQGVALDPETDWDIPDYAEVPHHVELLQSPVGRVVADVAGSEVVRDYLIEPEAGDFTALAWSGSPSAPTGWSVATLSQSAVTETVNGARFTVQAGTGERYARLRWLGAPMEIGKTYYIRTTISAWATGGIRLREVGGATIATLGPAGTYLRVHTATAGGVLELESARDPDGICDASVSTVEIYERLESTAGSAAAQLDSLVEYLCSRIDWPLEAVDWASVSQLAALGHPLGYYADRPVTPAEILSLIADSYGGWVTTDRFGRLSFGRLDVEATDVVLELGDWNLVGSIEIIPDLAPGLSSYVSGGRHWHVHTDAELAGSVRATALGNLLQERYRWRREGDAVIDWPNAVDDAIGRRARSDDSDRDKEKEVGMETLLQSPEAVQEVADYISGVYAGLKFVVRCSALLDRVVAARLEGGQRVRLWLDGKPRVLTIVSPRKLYGRPRVDLRLWGSLEEVEV